ncbi:MAG: hypothetical protein LBS35_09600 [Synergistaceae bacterium]|jgi:serine/threonine protein kinase|nr:hypothetical protein [Synergistaceae bacterium]
MANYKGVIDNRRSKALHHGQILKLKSDYRIEDVINCGSSCVVYAASRLEPGIEETTPVIVKELFPFALESVIERIPEGTSFCLDTVSQSDSVGEFAREMRSFRDGYELQIKLFKKDPNRTSVSLEFEPGNAIDPKKVDTSYIVMECREGASLDKNPGEIATVSAVASLFESLARTVGRAHKAGYLHLDIKPANIFRFADENRVSLFDFDAVKRKDIFKDFEKKPKTLEFLSFSGSWAAPEMDEHNRARWGEICEATDIFEIGAVMFWVVCGRQPDKKMIEKIACGKFEKRDLQKIGMICSFPKEEEILKKIFIRTLNPDISQRYRNTDLLIDDLLELQGAKWKVAGRKLSRWMAAAAVFIILTLALAGFGLYYYDAHFREHITYYADYVLKRGVPVGIHPLTKEEIKHRLEHYEIVTKDNKVRDIYYKNSKGAVLPEAFHSDWEHIGRPSHASFKYDNDGVLVQTEHFDENWQLNFRIKHSKNYENYVDIGFGDERRTLLSNVDYNNMGATVGKNERNRKNSNIARKRLEYNNKGFVVREIFFKDNSNIPASSIDGVNGVIYERDAEGRLLKVVYVDKDGNPAINETGYSCKIFSYDESGNHITTTYYDENQEPIPFNRRVVTMSYNYDAYGNIISIIYYADVQRKDIKQSTKMTIDSANGLLVRQEIASSLPKSFFRIEYEHDKMGRRIWTKIFDINGEYSASLTGYSVRQGKYDEFGRVTEINYYDPTKMFFLIGSTKSGGLVGVGDQFSSREYPYDVYEAPELGPCVTKDMVEYENGKICRRTYLNKLPFGQDSESIAGFAVRYTLHQEEFVYDDIGHISEVRKWNITPEKTKTLSSFTKLTYDANDNEICKEYFGPDGKPIEKGGYSKYIASFDENSFLKSASYFNTKGYPVMIRHWGQIDDLNYADIILSVLNRRTETQNLEDNTLTLPDGSEIAIDRIFTDDDMIYVVCSLSNIDTFSDYEFENFLSVIIANNRNIITSRDTIEGFAFVETKKTFERGFVETEREIVYLFKKPQNSKSVKFIKNVFVSINGIICIFDGNFSIDEATRNDENIMKKTKNWLAEKPDFIVYPYDNLHGRHLMVRLGEKVVNGPTESMPIGSKIAIVHDGFSQISLERLSELIKKNILPITITSEDLQNAIEKGYVVKKIGENLE